MCVHVVGRKVISAPSRDRKELLTTHVKILLDPWSFGEVNSVITNPQELMYHCLVCPLGGGERW